MSVARDNELNKVPADSFNDTVTRPLIRNPNPSHPKITNVSEFPSHHYSFSSHSTSVLALNHHLANIGTTDGQSKSEFIHEQPLGSSRWNPTPEQLLALEEMYRCGTRTPSAEQIQQIATQLRKFGKIEGKNVFYWFQNHKARERQKRRRREMEIINDNNPAEKKESGLRKTSYDIEQTKNWALSSNSSKHSEEFVSMKRAVAMPESTSGPQYGWTQFDDQRGLHQRKSTNNITAATWQTMGLWPSFDHRKFPKTQNLTKPYNENGHETQTLELFPLHRDDDDDDSNSFNTIRKNNKVVHITSINETNNFTPSPSQYIEFLPLKN